jgi:tRNA threonylcarbamoyladenosine biosynthesis protein TsaB
MTSFSIGDQQVGQYSPPAMREKSLTVLALDCSTSAGSVALCRGETSLADCQIEGRRQAVALLPAIAGVMDAAGLAWSAVDLIAVTVGPGSFTGLRVGLAAARGLALARHLPLAGVGTADLLAAAVTPQRLAGRRLMVAIDSRRDDLFIQIFSPDGLPLARVQALTPDQALSRQSGPLLVVGDAAPQFADRRSDLEISPSWPQAPLLAALALRRWRQGEALPGEPL